MQQFSNLKIVLVTVHNNKRLLMLAIIISVTFCGHTTLRMRSTYSNSVCVAYA